MTIRPLTIKHRCGYATPEQYGMPGLNPEGQIIEPGVQVEYLCHVPGGMVKVRHEGKEVIIHPGATELGTK